MGGDVPMKALSFGDKNPQGHVDMQTEPFQDGILLGFSPDTRDYCTAYLDNIVLPAELKGQHVYLQGMAPNFITGSLALTLAEACPSVSVAGQDGSFVCVYSTQPGEKARSGHRQKSHANARSSPVPWTRGEPPMPPR